MTHPSGAFTDVVTLDQLWGIELPLAALRPRHLTSPARFGCVVRACGSQNAAMSDSQPREAFARRRAKRYRLVRLPLWIRGTAVGVLFGGLMLAYARVTDERPGPLLFAVVGAGITAVLFAVVMTFFIRAMERRIFDAGGSPLTTDERILVLQAVDAGRWPDDPRLHPAAARVVAQRFSSAGRPAFQVPVFVAMFALALFQAVTDGSWWWAAVVFWLVAGPWAVFSSRHQRQSAQRLRDTAAAGVLG